MISPVEGFLPISSGQACLWTAFYSFLMKSRPHLWKQDIPQEDEDDCWVAEATELRITTPREERTILKWITFK